MSDLDVCISQMKDSTLYRVKVRPFILLGGIIVFPGKAKKKTVCRENSKFQPKVSVITVGNVISQL